MASEGSEPAKTYSTDPALYIFTSLTAGSSHIVTATSRLETILRANRIPFKATDIATDEKARMLWGRRAGKDPSGRPRKLPGLVQMGMVLGDIVEIEEWNEYGELKDHVTIYYDEFTQPSIHEAASKPVVGLSKPATNAAAPTSTATTTTGTSSAPAPPPPPAPPAPAPKAATTTTTTAKTSSSSSPAPAALPIRSIAEEAAAKAKQVHLQALREKVYGKGGAPPNKDKVETSTSSSSTTEAKPESKSEAATTKTPSPSSADVDPPVTELHGAKIKSASAEEIAAVEKAQAIKEEEEEEESEEEESEEESEEEEKGKAKTGATGATGAGENKTAGSVKN
ncbi:hypothetical protein VTJ04DRAFT_1117 [Mycothermus thermophilus]|uniref:uncharacterized protein n=1 Tax=Humicola insolens TaxID=85995 RepID=UPI0037428986